MTPTARRRRRGHSCACGRRLQRYWTYCPECRRALKWSDAGDMTGAECPSCGWVVSPRFSWCPWCQSDLYEEGVSSEAPLVAPRGFRLDVPCSRRCGGRVRFPMEFCPWCGGRQQWNYDDRFEGTCPHCGAGVDDDMEWCPWCGEDATGGDLIGRALTRVRRLLLVSRIRPWEYRVLLRPGISGVDPEWPNVIEIDQRYVVTARKRDEIPWKMLVGLITHELGHSFLFNNWSWTRDPEFRRLFGRVDKAYRGVDNSWVSFQRRRIATYTPDHVSGYAATHPLEDFAETFRFYVTRRALMRELLAELGRKRKGVVVYEKFLALHHFVRSLRRR